MLLQDFSYLQNSLFIAICPLLHIYTAQPFEIYFGVASN